MMSQAVVHQPRCAVCYPFGTTRRRSRVGAQPFVMAYGPMSVREMEAGPMGMGARTANERFRVGWHRQLGWSIGIAVALHAVAFAAARSVVLSYPIPDLDDALIETEGLLVLPFDDGTGSGQVMASPAASVGGALDASDEDADPAATLGSGGSAMDDDALLAALGERMRRRGGARVTRVVEPVVEPEPDRTVGQDESDASEADSDPEIEAGASTADLAELPEPDTLSLDRLSDLEPQLALVSASAWVLIRNQQEVEAYLRRGYRDGELDAAEVGSVSVTLWIDRMGSVEWAEISKSSGYPNLDEYALALFNEVADFRAAREQGVSVSRSVTFSLNFPW